MARSVNAERRRDDGLAPFPHPLVGMAATGRRRAPAKPKDGTVTDDNTQRAIGRLEGQMQKVISLLKSQDQRSSDSRARMHEAQEKTAREVHDLSRRVGKVEGWVSLPRRHSWEGHEGS